MNCVVLGCSCIVLHRFNIDRSSHRPVSSTCVIVGTLFKNEFQCLLSGATCTLCWVTKFELWVNMAAYLIVSSSSQKMMTCFCLTVGSRLVNISVWHSVCLYPGSCSQWLLRLAVALQCLPWPVCQLSHSCNPIVRLTPLLLFCFDNETGQEITSISSSIFPQKLLQQIFLVRIKKNWVTLRCGARLWVFGGLPVTPLIVDSWSVMLPLPILRQWQLLSDVWSCWMFLGFSLAIVMAKRCMNLLGV